MLGHGAKFDQKMEQAIAALLSHRSIEEAAREVGVSANTLSRWMKEPEFEDGVPRGAPHGVLPCHRTTARCCGRCRDDPAEDHAGHERAGSNSAACR